MELARRLDISRTRMKVLFISGYTDKATGHTVGLDPGVAFLPKPFEPEMLAHRVREALDK